MTQATWPYRFYVDYRLGGVPRWSLGEPKDARVRVPDDLLNTTVFIGGRNSDGRLEYRATGFFVGLPTTRVELGWPCLVTARHNVEKARAEFGNVWVRVNTADGGARDIEINEPWVYSDDPASDVAAIPWPYFDTEFLPIPPHWFITEEVTRNRAIGVGDDLIVIGLFSRHVGQARNLPIARSGNIASMPLEPLIDDSGENYNAYLAEVRSIGGLSGSPVFAVIDPWNRHITTDPEALVNKQVFYLLGMIRGHWPGVPGDYPETESDRLNTGIAIVTPITDALPLFHEEDFMAYKKQMDREYDKGRSGGWVEDWEGASPESEEFSRFQDLARRVVGVPKDEADEQRGEEN